MILNIWIWDGKFWSLSVEAQQMSPARAAELIAVHNVEGSSIRIQEIK